MVRFRDVCDALGMSIDSGYAHVAAGTFPIPLVKVGAIWKARRVDLERFLYGETS